jgi:hypothetical protein
LVEYLLPKQKVAGSSPVSRSNFSTNIFGPEPYCPYRPARGVKTVTASNQGAVCGKAQDLQSRARQAIARKRLRVRQIDYTGAVERQLPKLDVAGSIPVSRSMNPAKIEYPDQRGCP